MQSARGTEGKCPLTDLLTSMIVLLALRCFLSRFTFCFLKAEVKHGFDQGQIQELERMPAAVCAFVFILSWQALADVPYALQLPCLEIQVAFKQSAGPCIQLPSLVPAEQLPNALKPFNHLQGVLITVKM